MNTVMPPNRRLDEIFGYIKKLSPDQLTELIRTNPNSTEATLALGLVNSQNDFRDRVQGQQGDMPTVKDGILGVGVNQNNADMRMDGIAAVPMEPQNSSVVPMSGVAGIPAREMTMTAAQGGLIGFAGEGDSLVEEPESSFFDSLTPDRLKDGFQVSDIAGLGSDAYEYAKENPGKAAIGAALTVPAAIYGGPLTLAGVGLRGLAGLGARTAAGKYVGQKIGQYGGNFVARQGNKVADKFSNYLKNRLKTKVGPAPAPAGAGPLSFPIRRTGESIKDFKKRMDVFKNSSSKFKEVRAPKKFKLQGKNESNAKFKKRQAEYTKQGNARAKYEKQLKEWNKKKTAQSQYRKDYDAARLVQGKNVRRLGKLGAGVTAGGATYSLLDDGSDSAEDPLAGYSVERADGKGAGAVAGTGKDKDKDKSSYVADALIAGGLGYASGKNIGESGIIGLEYANKRRSSMSDKEKLAYDRETQTKVAQIKANNAREASERLTNADKMRFSKVVTEFTTDAQNGLPKQKRLLKAQYGNDITSILQELGVDIAQYQLQAEGRDPEAFLDSVIDQVLTEKFKADYIAQTGIRSPTGSS